MGYRSLDEAKRMVVDRMRSEVDPTKDWDSLIRVRSTPPQREDDGEVSLDFENYRGLPPVCCPRCTHQEQSEPKHTNATEPMMSRMIMLGGLARAASSASPPSVAVSTR